MIRIRKFTLIELLVVLAIIGILVTLLLPSLKKAREKAMRAVCASNNKQISIATYAYSKDNNQRVQCGGTWIRWSPAMLYVMYQTNFSGYAKYKDRPVNLGLLISEGYAGSWENDEIFRCPSIQKSTNSAGDPSNRNYFEPSDPDIEWVNSRADYLRRDFNPLEDDWTGISLMKLDPSDPIYADSFSTGKMVRNTHGEGVTVQFISGSVKFIRAAVSPRLNNSSRNNFNNNRQEINTFWDAFKENY